MRERLQWQKNSKFIYNIKLSGKLAVHKTRSKFALCEFNCVSNRPFLAQAIFKMVSKTALLHSKFTLQNNLVICVAQLVTYHEYSE